MKPEEITSEMLVSTYEKVNSLNPAAKDTALLCAFLTFKLMGEPALKLYEAVTKSFCNAREEVARHAIPCQ